MTSTPLNVTDRLHWLDPIPVEDLRVAPLERWRGHGANESYTVTLPDGRSYFLKQPGRASAGSMLGRRFHRGDHDTELTANRMLRLLGVSFAHGMESVERPDRGTLLASPFLPGLGGSPMLTSLTCGDRDAERAFRELARGLPPDQVAEAAFAQWIICAADRHWNNYLWSEGLVLPIDFGYSIFPRADTRYQWDGTRDALRDVAGFSDAEWSALPVPRAVLASATVQGDELLRLVEGHARRHHGWGQWAAGLGAGRVMDHYRRKLESVRRLLGEPSKTVTLGVLGIGGMVTPPA